MSRSPGKYPKHVRERAVQMVFDHEDQYDSQWAAIVSIAEKFGMTSEPLRRWVRQAETDAGRREGLTTDDKQRLAEGQSLEREIPRATSLIWTYST